MATHEKVVLEKKVITSSSDNTGITLKPYVLYTIECFGYGSFDNGGGGHVKGEYYSTGNNILLLGIVGGASYVWMYGISDPLLCAASCGDNNPSNGSRGRARLTYQSDSTTSTKGKQSSAVTAYKIDNGSGATGVDVVFADGGTGEKGGKAINSPSDYYMRGSGTYVGPAGGDGGNGYPGGGGGCGGSTFSKTEYYFGGCNHSNSHTGSPGGNADYKSTWISYNGTSYGLRYGSGGSGGASYTAKNGSHAGGSSPSAGGAGGQNYINSIIQNPQEYSSNSSNAKIELIAYIYENDIVVNSTGCVISVSNDRPKKFETITIYVKSVQSEYTLKSITIYNTTYSLSTLESNWKSQNPDYLYEVEYTLPDIADRTIYITNDYYVNPIINVIYNNVSRIGYHVLSNERPKINSKFGFSDIQMLGGWKYANSVLFTDNESSSSSIISYALSETMFTCLPEYAGKTINIKIYENLMKIPMNIKYYNYVYSSYSYDNIFEEYIYGDYYGQILPDYTVKQFEGYHESEGRTVIKNIVVDAVYATVNIYLIPNEYNITALYGNVSSHSYHKAYYSERVSVIFNWAKYDGNERDRFRGWRNDKSYDTKTSLTSDNITFIMPPTDLAFYPIMTPERKNSNVYKNKYTGSVDGTYIENSFNDNMIYDGDIFQKDHGFVIGDVVYYDNNVNLYKKALAENSIKALYVGIVHNVQSKDVFGIQSYGPTEIKYEWNDARTSLLYLSDKEPGKLVGYEEIENKIYIPVCVWTDNELILTRNPMTKGITYKEYPVPKEDLGPIVENYSTEELDNTVSSIWTNMTE